MAETKFGNIQTKFTPGKYHVVRHNWKECSIEADSGHTLCTSDIEGGVDEDGENQDEMMEWQDAQMAFFAAAPEMYEFIESFVRDFEGNYVVDGEIVDNPSIILTTKYKIALRLLAKARGEKQ